MSCTLNISQEGKVQSFINPFASDSHMILEVHTAAVYIPHPTPEFVFVVNFEIASYSVTKAARATREIQIFVFVGSGEENFLRE